jgi:hypothetical protein
LRATSEKQIVVSYPSTRAAAAEADNIGTNEPEYGPP